jgi:hypothetical protein
LNKTAFAVGALVAGFAAGFWHPRHWTQQDLTMFWYQSRPEMRGAINQGCVYVEPYYKWKVIGWPGANQRIKKGWSALTDGEKSWCERTLE